MRTIRLIAALFGVAIVLINLAPAKAQGTRDRASACNDAQHPPDFVVAGTYFHINRGTTDVDDARFQVATDTGEIVAYAQSRPGYTFEALIPWRYCANVLRIETIVGNRFSVALELKINPGRDIIDNYGRRVVRLTIPITEGPRSASAFKRRKAFLTVIGGFESSLSRYNEYAKQHGFHYCCPTTEAQTMYIELVKKFDQADSLLADSERSQKQYVGMSRYMADLISIARGRSDLAPISWLARLETFSSDIHFTDLAVTDQARLSRILSSAAASLVAGVGASQSYEALSVLRTRASALVDDVSSMGLLRALASNPKNIREMWNLTKDNGIALVAIEGNPAGALDLYVEFFGTAPIGHEVVPLEVQRRLAVQSAVYYGQYLDAFTKRGEMKQVDYVASVRKDPKTLAYWSAFAVWLKRNEGFFAAGTTEEARLLKAYSALAATVAL